MHNYDNSEKSVDVQASQWCCPYPRDTTVLSQHFPLSEEQENKNSDALFKDENNTLRTRRPTQWLKKNTLVSLSG